LDELEHVADRCRLAGAGRLAVTDAVLDQHVSGMLALPGTPYAGPPHGLKRPGGQLTGAAAAR
jgi:hypothetical protein